MNNTNTGDAQWAFDLGFLALGAALLVGGLMLARKGERDTMPELAPR